MCSEPHSGQRSGLSFTNTTPLKALMPHLHAITNHLGLQRSSGNSLTKPRAALAALIMVMRFARTCPRHARNRLKSLRGMQARQQSEKNIHKLAAWYTMVPVIIPSKTGLSFIKKEGAKSIAEAEVVIPSKSGLSFIFIRRMAVVTELCRNPFEIRSQFHPKRPTWCWVWNEGRNPFEIRSQFHRK